MSKDDTSVRASLSLNSKSQMLVLPGTKTFVFQRELVATHKKTLMPLTASPHRFVLANKQDYWSNDGRANKELQWCKKFVSENTNGFPHTVFSWRGLECAEFPSTGLNWIAAKCWGKSFLPLYARKKVSRLAFSQYFCSWRGLFNTEERSRQPLPAVWRHTSGTHSTSRSASEFCSATTRVGIPRIPFCTFENRVPLTYKQDCLAFKILFSYQPVGFSESVLLDMEISSSGSNLPRRRDPSEHLASGCVLPPEEKLLLWEDWICVNQLVVRH